MKGKLGSFSNFALAALQRLNDMCGFCQSDIRLKFSFSRIIFLAALLLLSCEERPNSGAGRGGRDDNSVAEARSRVYDYGDIKNYNKCRALPRRNLSIEDQCMLSELAKNCTRAADCLITCESSPDGFKVGGGCYHVCFGPEAGNKWDDRPEIDFSKCRRGNN